MKNLGYHKGDGFEEIINLKLGGIKVDKFTRNLRKLIEIQGLSAAMGSISAMLAYDIKTIEELNNSIVDEIYYSLEQLENY